MRSKFLLHTLETWRVYWTVAIPFKWGQSFYSVLYDIDVKIEELSQSLLNEVKVSTLTKGQGSTVIEVAIPFKWGQSFYKAKAPTYNLRPGVAIPFKWGQSFYSRAITITHNSQWVAIPFKWGQSFYDDFVREKIFTLNVAIPFKWGQSFYKSGLMEIQNPEQSQSLLNEVKVSTLNYRKSLLAAEGSRNPF